jgi:hypothetical protein
MKPMLPLLIATAVVGCTKTDPITSSFLDSFDRQQLGVDYNNTGGPYKIASGQLHIRGAYNKPLWLKRQLPRDAEIEFDVVAKSADGDIKVEAWGDGESAAAGRGAYLATSYVFVMGGWGNRVSALCRMDEHAPDRKERQDIKVVAGKTYHWKIRRKGSRVDWLVDGQPFLALDDPQPLEGPRHSYLGFNNWQSDVYFDNLKITALK